MGWPFVILKRIQNFLTWIGRNLHFARFQFITHESIKGKNKSYSWIISWRFMGFIQMHSTQKFVARSTYQNGLKALFMKLKYIWLWSPLGRPSLKGFQDRFYKKISVGYLWQPRRKYYWGWKGGLKLISFGLGLVTWDSLLHWVR